VISQRALDIPSFLVMDVLEKAHEMERHGQEIVHLEVGEPDFETPECVKRAAIEAIRLGMTKYTHSMGLLELREAIVEYYLKKYGVGLSPEQVIVTMGSSPALFLVFSALLEQGDKVVLANPYYACYPHIIRFLGGEATFVYGSASTGFQYQPQQVRGYLVPRTKAIMINSPANPTGSILPRSTLEELADLPPYLVSDETYQGLVYETREHSVLEFSRRAFVVGSFSKQFSMTGWRLGYVIAPHEFIRPLQKIHQNFFISANSFVQRAGVAALREAGEDVARMREVFDQRRKFIISRLQELGFGLQCKPQGAFYVLADAHRVCGDSKALAFDILAKAQVALTPGIDFGDNAEGYLRFSYANSLKNIEKGMERLAEYLKRF
jgi:(5-formylfuran-3-yl)methyl phosphate transaminase